MPVSMTRKEFLRVLGLSVPALFYAGRSAALPQIGKKSVQGSISRGDAPSEPWKWSIEAFYYTSAGQGLVCGLCPNRCVLYPGDRGICRSRVNIKGKLYSLTYGNPCTFHVDPIEKKPLNHFYPSTSIFSIAAAGCNFRCLNCQNWEISQKKPEEVRHFELFPEDVVKEAKKRGVPSIAFTYSEPITYYEYMFDTARIAREAGLNNLMISNGYINRQPLVKLSRYLDGANINLKSFDNETYKRLNGGRLQPVLNTFKTLHGEGVWFEMTTLVVPTYVDDLEMVKRMCGWILKELGPDYPLHFLRFFPQYKLKRLPPTPVTTLERFREAAMREGIRYVYVGNVPGHEACHTYCHQCGRLLIERNGYSLGQFNLKDGRCLFCKAIIPGRWAGRPSK